MKVALIYLAAGNSRRFGSNKLLYEVGERPMYRHLLERLVSVCSRHPDWDIVVVTRYRKIADGTADLPIICVFSPDSERGISYSIRAGLLAAPHVEAYAFFVADQPWLTEESAEGFLLAMEHGETGLGCVCCSGESGNPTWFSAKYRDELLSLDGDRGGKTVLKAYPDDVTYYEIPAPHELYDIDSWENTGHR